MSVLLNSVFLKLPNLSCSAMVCPQVAQVRILAVIALLVFPGIPACSAQSPDLTQTSLEDLMNIEVTSVSKKEQKTSHAAAAIFVITSEDIRRSNALNIPDLLRMVPGLDVAQIDGGKWAVSARGFNSQYSNKLLVLIDGRTVYNPEFAGVLWDSQNVPLDSIERIELVRGPGAAIWGTNAVNGVINIITKSTVDTQGGMITASAGNAGTGPETIRYGGKARNLGAYRVYAEGFQINSLRTPAGLDGKDDWRYVHGGFRTDSTLSARDSLTTEGEAYHGNAGEIVYSIVSMNPPENATTAMRDRYSGGNLLSRWKRTISPTSETSLQVYFDRTTRGDPTYSVGLNIFDIDFQHHIALASRQDLVWGVGYRVSSDGVNPTLRLSASPRDRLNQLFSSFVQDEIALRPNFLFLTVGARLEHNDFSGASFEPSIRLAWTPNCKNMVWSAVSGADRIPARSDADVRVNYAVPSLPNSLPIILSYLGNPNEKNERLTAFEAGYRNTWTNRFSVDSTAFYNRYRDLGTEEPGAPRLEAAPAPMHMLIPYTFGNGMYGETHGLETFANWKVTSFWTLSPGYAFLSMHLHRFAGSRDTSTPRNTEGNSPDHQAQMRSSVSLPWNLQWNASAYFVNRLSTQSLPSYTRLDSSLTWRAGDRVSVNIAGQNLLKGRHEEFAGGDSSVQSGMMRRNVFAKIVWSF
jgi:iron complex outermembrane receptor protein